MMKLCSCFEGSSDERKKNETGRLKEKKYDGLGFFLFGDDESGRTKIIDELVNEDDPFTRQDKILKISEIERYIRDAMTDALRAFQESDPSGQFDYPENHRRMNYILTTAHATDFDYPIDFFLYVESLWTDRTLQDFLNLPNTYKLPDSAKYILNRVPDIRDPDYFPTTEDMIYSRLFPFQIFQKSFDINSKGVRLEILEMNVFDEKQQELIQSFGNKTSTIIFMADCSSFDEVIDDQGSKTRLHQSIDLYKIIRNEKLFEGIPVILLFNKQDRLARKIQRGNRLEFYFPEFEGYLSSTNIDSNEDPEFIRAKHFIAQQFLAINSSHCIHHWMSDSDLTLRLILNDYRALHQ